MISEAWLQPCKQTVCPVTLLFLLSAASRTFGQEYACLAPHFLIQTQHDIQMGGQSHTHDEEKNKADPH